VNPVLKAIFKKPFVVKNGAYLSEEGCTLENQKQTNEAFSLKWTQYVKKALPRELIDDYFRSATKDISHEDMMALSEQLSY
jgi:hypothetical protein